MTETEVHHCTLSLCVVQIWRMLWHHVQEGTYWNIGFSFCQCLWHMAGGCLQKKCTNNIINTALFRYNELRDAKRIWIFTPNAQLIHIDVSYSLLHRWLSSSSAACGVARGSYRSKHSPPSLHTTQLPNTILHSSSCNLAIDHLQVRGKEFEESCCHYWGQFTYVYNIS